MLVRLDLLLTKLLEKLVEILDLIIRQIVQVLLVHLFDHLGLLGGGIHDGGYLDQVNTCELDSSMRILDRILLVLTVESEGDGHP